MKIADATADVPQELIAEQERGGVVFLCGAGVSQRVGLPSFDRLTRNVYTRLHENWEGHPAEAEAMGPGPGQAVALDRALFALAKRLRGPDPASRMRAEHDITAAIEAELAPPDRDLAAHRDIIRLSRDPEMRSRVVTTNFDTLFERAWPAGQAPSRACADVPAPGTTDFVGVLHLHGRIEDPALGLTRTPLVLNSAEFGEAYLRAGWAARFIYDLSRATTLVIVGYAADDPPMRYILEVLTADRERYPDLKQIFAFAPCAPDASADARKRVAAIWDAKGAIALLYDSRNATDHDALYGTLAAWADFADDPSVWRRTHAERVLALDPELVGEEDWSRLRWMLSTGNAFNLLAEVNPHPRWAAPLGRAGLLASDCASPGSWILRRLHDPDMPSSVLESVPFDAGTIALLEHGLTWRNPQLEPLAPHLAKAWRLILETVDRGRRHPSSRWHHAMRALRRGDASLAVRRSIIECLRPRARPRRPFHWPGIARDVQSGPGFQDILEVEFGPSQIHDLDDLAANLPAERRRNMVRALSSALEDALEDAVEFEFVRPGRDGPSSDVRSVARHLQDSHPDGFYPVVRATIDIWELIAAEKPCMHLDFAREHLERLLTDWPAKLAKAALGMAGDDGVGLGLDAARLDALASDPELVALIPATQIVGHILPAYVRQIAGFSGPEAKIERSFGGDLVHALYLPHVDLWRADRRFAALVSGAVPQYADRVVVTAKALPAAIDAWQAGKLGSGAPD